MGWKKDVGSDVSNGCKIVYNYQKEIPYIPFEITKENRHLTGYKGVKNEKLVIPETFEHEGKYYKVNSIGKEAFKNCIDLTSVVISNSITSIGDDAFAHSGLTSIVIPDSVTSIGAGAFVDCTGLTSVDLGNGVTSLGLYAFCDCRGLTSVTIPDSVTSIGKEAFSGCHNLISVDLGNGVTSIGDCAFLYCSGLTSIVIPDSVTTLGKGVFAVCYDLTTIYYKGSKLDWKKNMGSATLKDCKIIYNYKDNI